MLLVLYRHEVLLHGNLGADIDLRSLGSAGLGNIPAHRIQKCPSSSLHLCWPTSILQKLANGFNKHEITS